VTKLRYDEDYWDGSWVITVSRLLPAASPQRPGSLRMGGLHRLNEGLKFIDQNLFGAAVLERIEVWNRPRDRMRTGGRISVAGRLSDQRGKGTSLRSNGRRRINPTSRWIASLDAIEAAFPVVGKTVSVPFDRGISTPIAAVAGCSFGADADRQTAKSLPSRDQL
jgi:hypothetical protein